MESNVTNATDRNRFCVYGTFIALLLLCTAPQRLIHAQVHANIWSADTAWFDEQGEMYLPFDMPVHVSVRNVGSKIARDVQLKLFSQEALMFADKLLTRTVDVASVLHPGDSIDVLLDMKQNIQRSGKLRYPPQLYWLVEWTEDSAQVSRMTEGRGIAMHLGNCTHGAIINDVVTELTLPDTILLDHSSEYFTLEVPCRLYSSFHRPLLLKDVVLEVEGESMFRETISVERIKPSASLDSMLLSDTLELNFKVSIPSSVVSTDLMFHIQPGIYLDSGCPFKSIIDGGRRFPVHVRHTSERKIAFTYEVAEASPGGSELQMRIGSWCGGVPVAIRSNMLEVTDTGGPIDTWDYNNQRYEIENTPLRVIFAIDLTESMGMHQALQRAKDLVVQASHVVDPRRDSLIVYTLTDHARHHPEATVSSAGLINVLDSLQVLTGTEVFLALDEAVEQEIRFPHDGEVLMYFITDGWQPQEAAALASVLSKASQNGIHIRCVSPVLDFNTEVMHWYYLPMDIAYDMVHWRTSAHRYSRGFLSYPISCAYGTNRDFSLMVRDWCGTDTVMTGTYAVPGLAEAPRELRIQSNDIQVTSGEAFALSLSYSFPKTSTWRNTEFVLEYDTLVLRLDSIETTGLPPGAFYQLHIDKGMVHFASRLDRDSGFGPIGTFHFSTFASVDTVRTSVFCYPWALYDGCVPGFPCEVAVTTVPLSTAVDVSVSGSGVQLFDLFPQPVRDRLTLKYRSDPNGPRTIRIVDLLGRVRWQGELPRGQSSTNMFIVDIPSILPSGTYVLQILSSSEDKNVVPLLSRRFQIRK